MRTRGRHFFRERSMATPSFSGIPDFDSELFEQVTDDELALLEYYRALKPDGRAAVLEALVRMVEPGRQAQRRRRGRPGGAASDQIDAAAQERGLC